MIQPRPVALLTDFGHRDPYVGICHGVMLRIEPALQIIDITHGVRRQDIDAGAIALAEAAPYMPEGTVFVGIVDPGVGSDRRALAIEAENGSFFVGPDNGLLAPALKESGGAVAVWEISNSAWRLEPVSNTFNGRDIFAPVGAMIAAGASPGDGGESISVDRLVSMPEPRVEWSGDAAVAPVTSIDTFGNVRLAGRLTDFGKIYRGDRVEITAGDRTRSAVAAASYAEGEPGALLLVEDSSGALTLAVRGGDAAELLGLAVGERVRISRQ